MKTRYIYHSIIFSILLFLPGMLHAQNTEPDRPYISQVFVGVCSPETGVFYPGSWNEGEFIELYNPTSYTWNISGCILGDPNSPQNNYCFPENTIILPQSYLMIAYCPDYILESGYDLYYLFPSIYEDMRDRQILYQSDFNISFNGINYFTLYFRGYDGYPFDILDLYEEDITRVRNMNLYSVQDNYLWTIWTHLSKEEPYPDTTERIGIGTYPITRSPWLWRMLSNPGGSDPGVSPPPVESDGFDESSQDKNFIYSRTMLSADSSKYIDQVQYFDGLGRPTQTIQKGITPSKQDLITLQEYDALGRKSNSWLAIRISDNQGKFVDPTSFSTIAVQQYNNDQKPYSKPVYDESPLNRLQEQYGPGQQWHSNGKSIRTEYLSNTASGVQSCAYYKVTGSSANPILTKNNNYGQNQLYVNKLTDEDGNIMYEFKDKSEKVLLTRQMNGLTEYNTYYVYDDFNNLVFVLPPMAADGLTSNTTWNINTNTYLKRDAYVYKYDKRNRCIEKKLPGIDPITYIYDDADRLIFSQDGEQRLKGIWSFSFPDALGRVVVSGTCKNVPASISGVVKATYTGSGSLYGYTYEGINTTLNSITILLTNYYDNYKFKTEVSPFKNNSNYAYTTPGGFEDKRYGSDNISYAAKGILTGSLVFLLDDSNSAPLGSVYYYDKKGRMIQSISSNHLDGYEKEYINYSFSGQPIWRQMAHTSQYLYQHNMDILVQTYTYEYDHADRLIETKHKINTDDEVLLSKLGYDELGRVGSKTIHNNKVPLDYGYNIRSWMTEIRSPEFGQTLYYNDSYFGSIPRYNGNISAMSYGCQGDYQPAGFSYSYDGLNRLKKSEFFNSEPYPCSGSFTEEMDYDKMGNITELKRYDISPDLYSAALIDYLSMLYNGNQLMQVIENVDNDLGFTTNNIFTDHYVYNNNGAMLWDRNKGIEQIIYNQLNLPKMIAFEGSNYTFYLYDAAGVKRRVTHGTNQSGTTSGGLGTGGGISIVTATDYCGSVIYEGGQLSRILTSEGYLTLNKRFDPPIIAYSAPVDVKDALAESLPEIALLSEGDDQQVIIPVNNMETMNMGFPPIGGDPIVSNSSFQYNYFVNDYLGNVRAVLTWNKNGLVTGNYSVTQRTDYYAFGLPTSHSTNPEAQPYKREGKEYDEMHGLNQYDQGARFFNPQLPVTPTPDPLAEKYYSVSPYAQWGNNPVRFVDPDGMDIYRYDDKTGDFILHQNTDDDFDQVGKFKYDKKTDTYILKTNKKGKAKTRIDNVEKGILSDGINFKENSNIIFVGGKGQATEKGVETFALELSEMVGKEIGGAYFSKDGAESTTHMSIGAYKNNTYTVTKGSGHLLWNRLYPDSKLENNITGFFHTHPSGGTISVSDRTRASYQDIEGRVRETVSASFLQ